MKLNKSVIVKSKTMNGDEIFLSGWNMENIVENKITGMGGNNGITNTVNCHTVTSHP
jgi:hypothetical protein